MSEYSDASLVLIPSGVKDGKLYSQKPLDGTGDFTVSRNTDATYVDKNGIIQTALPNVARIDYTDGGCGALLVEPQSTNLALWSEQFDNAYWIKDGATISANATTSPDGYTNADKLEEDSSTGVHRYGKATFPSGTQRTFSVFAKKGERNFVCLFENNIVGPQVKGVIFNLNTGTLSLNNFPSYYINPTITDYGNGWYRCSATWTPLSLSVPSVGVSADGLTNSYAGTTGIGIFVYGAQLEVGTEANSYIPTTTTSVTRAADIETVTTPAGVTSITETIGGVDQTPITVIPATYQIPNGNINKIIMK